MITVVQRVRRATVTVEDRIVGAIGRGLLLLVGVEQPDGPDDAVATARKVQKLRCFAGRTPMDATVADIGGACLVVSQFTLAAELAQGNRPSFVAAADPAIAAPLYERVAAELRTAGLEVATGEFGAGMQVDLQNDGPVTFVLTVRGGRVLPRRD
ncbi:MAG: D-aminoacyl-tRNA deacylase [Planctomycetota bacterium]